MCIDCSCVDISICMIKHLIIGLGMVGKSFLRLLIENNLFRAETFYCLDNDISACASFIEAGGEEKHFILETLASDNYASVLSFLSEGDFVFDFACDVRNIDLLLFALEKRIHYLSTADSGWDVFDPNWTSAHQHFLEYVKIRKNAPKPSPTSIIEFGMNPGLVSCFVRKCLESIVESDTGVYVTKHRKKLLSLLKKRQYNIVAKKLRVEYVIEVDNDNQEFINQDISKPTVLSPWSPRAFLAEALSCPEVMFSNRKQFYQYESVRDCDFKDLYVSIKKQGIDCTERLFSPQGMTVGHLLTHEEVFSFARFLRCFGYRPTVLFVYSPCKIALSSVVANSEERDVDYQKLSRDRYISGGESVGVIIQGRRFNTRYYGNYLESLDIPETATILQVSSAVFSAFQYMRKHPLEGMLFPEELDSDEILAYARLYLKEYISVPCPDVVPNLGKQ